MNQTNIASMKVPSGQGFHHGKEKTTVYVVGVYTTVRHCSGVPVRPTGYPLESESSGWAEFTFNLRKGWCLSCFFVAGI